MTQLDRGSAPWRRRPHGKLGVSSTVPPASRKDLGLGHLAAVAAVVAFCSAAAAQVKSRPVHEGSGPLSDISTNVRAGSGPVRGAGGSLRGSSHDRMGGKSVRSSTTGPVTSGTVSDASAGPVSAKPRPALPPRPEPRVVEPPLGGTGEAIDSPSDDAGVDDGGSEDAYEEPADPARVVRDLRAKLRRVEPLPRHAVNAGESAADEPPVEAEAQPQSAEAAEDGGSEPEEEPAPEGEADEGAGESPTPAEQ